MKQGLSWPEHSTGKGGFHYLAGNRRGTTSAKCWLHRIPRCQKELDMTNYREIADRYLAIWNEPEPQLRRALIEARWSPDGLYVDPLMRAEGRDGIATMIGSALARFPGHGFSLQGEPDGHGRHIRFSWTLAPFDGAAIAAGTDIAMLDDQGRFVDVVGFLDGLPAHG
jgi:hypothetical protein